MENDRIKIYGKDPEGKTKRAFDMIMIQGSPYVETKDSRGHRIITPINEAISAIEQLKHQTG